VTTRLTADQAARNAEWIANQREPGALRHLGYQQFQDTLLGM
jgi:hypothetical protein